MNHIPQTSLNAYYEIRPELGARQREVLEAFKASNMALCDLDIAKALNSPINTITPRRGELLEKGLIAWTGYGTNKWGRTVRQYRLTAKGATLK